MTPIRRTLGFAFLGVALTVGCADEDRTGGHSRLDMRDATADAAGALDIGPDFDGPAWDAALPDNPLAPRVENRTCRLPEPPPIGELDVAPVFPELNLIRPLWFGTAPGYPELRFVVEQAGRIKVFDANDPAGVQDFLAHRVSRASNEEGLLGLAFHPRYRSNGYFYVYYSAEGGEGRRSVVSRFQADPDNPRRALPDSEQVLLTIPQPFGNHNGGDLHFGPDGYLYISVGDGGSGGDPQGHGQNTETLLGAILRVDVDTSDDVCLTRYGIPADNPFATGRCGGGQSARPEIYAYGLRNVWRMSFDRSTGELWAADVGQDRWEEIDLIVRGGNYGWNVLEGDECFRAACDGAPFEAPVHVYDHGEGRSITGGLVYRGPEFPELWGAYIFGDYNTGRIWALRRPAVGPAEVTLLARSRDITSFGQDPDGRLYIVTFDNGGTLYTLRPRAGGAPQAAIPRKLSETGCFSDVASHTVAPGVVPYEINAPLWSDGTHKPRYLALLGDRKMAWRSEGNFEFPVGTVLIKSFELDDPDGNSRRLETRLLGRGETGWLALSYRWNEAQTDADLLVGSLDEEVMGPGGPQTWQYPSRAQCEECHTVAARFTLGLSAAQLNRTVDYDGVAYNQLAALAGGGYVDLPGEPSTLPAFPEITDSDADLGARARAYLESNCAGCHRPDGVANAQLDLRATIPLADSGACDTLPGQNDLNIPDARLIAPGDPGRSVLLQRMLRRGPGQMPPLGTTVVDGAGTALVGAWIQSLSGCR